MKQKKGKIIPINNSKIFIQTWLRMKPYKAKVVTDSFYIELANKLRKTITDDPNKLIPSHLTEEEVSLTACVLASYLEDLVSGTNIWNTFVRLHTEFYGTRLPFCEETEFYENEPDYEDVKFLVWYCVSTISNDAIIDPNSYHLKKIAGDLTDIIHEAYEYAPENPILKRYYAEYETEQNFFPIRFSEEYLLFNTYLFFPDTGLLAEKEALEIYKKNNENNEAILYDTLTEHVANTHTKLLALRANEWLAELLGAKHPLYPDLKAQTKRVQGLFQLKKQSEQSMYFEHIASGMNFDVTMESFNKNSAFPNEGDLVLFGLVKWKNEWWFAGAQAILKNDRKIVESEKNSQKALESVSFLQNMDEKAEILAKQQTAFLEHTKGAQFVKIPIKEIDSFLHKFYDFYNEKYGKGKSPDKAMTSGTKIFNTAKNRNAILTVFFNPKKGIEISQDIWYAFEPVSEKNPATEQRESADSLVDDRTLSSELAHFWYDNYAKQLDIKPYSTLSKQEFDFLLRYSKRNNYHSEPEIYMI